jgi:hypothetical protein
VGPAARREGILARIIVVLARGLTWPVNKGVLLSLSPQAVVATRASARPILLWLGA